MIHAGITRLVKNVGAAGVALVLLLTAAASLAAQEEGPRAKVTLYEEAVVTGPRILLRDIARVESGDPELLAVLEELDLGRAPVPRQTVYLNEPRIRVAMRRERLPEKEIAFYGPEGNGNVAIVSASTPAVSGWGVGRPSVGDEPSSGATGYGKSSVGYGVGRTGGHERGRGAADARAGRQVGLLVRLGPVEIWTLGILEEDGRLGEPVRVRWEGAERGIWGVLVAPDRVEVNLPEIPGEGEP